MSARADRYLITRGLSWKKLRTWKLLRMTDQPHLLTCHQRRGDLSACLTAHEAARIAFRLLPGAEVFMWDEPNWIPTRSTAGHTACRIVATVDANGVWATERQGK